MQLRVASLFVLLVLLAPGWEALRAQRRPPSVREARASFASVVAAARALDAIEVTQGDSNGQVRAWDRVWRARVREATTRFDGCLPATRPPTCREIEVDALACQVGSDVGLARDALYDSERRTDLLQHMARELASRRALADAAVRRGAAHLSCEDLPGLRLGRRLPGVPPRSDVAAALRVAADGVASATEHEPAVGVHDALDGIGGPDDGAPLPSSARGGPPPPTTDDVAALRVIAPRLRTCARRDDSGSSVVVVVHVDASGTVDGVAIDATVSTAEAECLRAELRALQPRAGTDRSIWYRVSLRDGT